MSIKLIFFLVVMSLLGCDPASYTGPEYNRVSNKNFGEGNRKLETEAKVINVTSGQPNGVYLAGDTIKVDVEFSRPVHISSQSYLLLDTARVPGKAYYDKTQGGGEKKKVSYLYKVRSQDETLDLSYVDIGSLTLDGTDVPLSVDPKFNDRLPVPQGNGSLSGNKDIIINLPKSLGGASLWLDATDPLAEDGKSIIDSHKVRRWFDKADANKTSSFEDDHIVTQSSFEAPIYSTSSQKRVHFNGEETGLKTTLLGQNEKGWTYFFVFSSDHDDDNRSMIFELMDEKRKSLKILSAGNNYKLKFNGKNQNLGSVSQSATLVTVRYFEQTFTIYLRGTFVSEFKVNRKFFPKELLFAVNQKGKHYFKGNIYEVIGYDSPLNEGDIELLQNYLIQKWR